MNRQLALVSICIGLCAVCLAGRAAVADADTLVRISSGIEYTTGDYGGTTDLDEVYVPFNFSISRGRIGARLTVPYLRVDGPAYALYGGLDEEADPAALEEVSESGLGDVVASLTVYDVVTSDRLDVAIDVTGKVKFGTADPDHGLGTGETDYTLLVDAYKFVGSGALVGTFGYKLRGEPAGIDLDDVFLGSVGGLMEIGDRARFGVFYDYRDAALPDGDALREVSVFGSHDLGSAWRIQYYVFTGFTDGGPDWGGGVQLGVNLPNYSARTRD